MIRVQKADGMLEVFDEFKVRSSLKRAGVDDISVNNILTNLKDRLYDGIPSDKIYRSIYQLFSKQSKTNYRYNLKRAIMDLGPTGYPFEHFVAGVLSHYGYEVEVGKQVFGGCVSHEIDVIAVKDGIKNMVECKFHNQPGAKSGIRTVLYTYARFLDTRDKNQFQSSWLATNTKVTSEAIQYANCVGMRILSWNYPSDFCLRLLVERANLHPITARDDLSSSRKSELLRQGIVFLKDLKD